VPEGYHLIEISHIGFATITQNVLISSDTKLDFAMSQSIIENNEVVITGVSSATQSKRVSTPITVVKKEELFTNASTNIIEGLTKKPGVSSITTGPGISKPVIRGLGYNRVITMNDGIKQEGQQWGDEHGIEIDELSVNRVEILKGPAALTYGSDALAGVINIITNIPAQEGTIKGNLFSNYQTNNHDFANNVNLAGNLKGINWNVYTTLKRAEDYKNKYDGKVFNSRYYENNFGGYVGYNGSWGFSHLLFSNFDQHIGLIEGDRDEEGFFVKALPDGNEARVTAGDYDTYKPQVPFQHIVHSKIALDNNIKIHNSTLLATVGYQRNQRKEFGDAADPAKAGLFFNLGTLTYSARLNLPEKSNWKLSFGLNGISQRNQNKGIEFLIPEYTSNDIGGFVYAKKELGKLNISGGARLDNRDLNSGGFIENGQQKFTDFKRSFTNVSGSLGSTYAVTDHFTLKANVARGFRAPSIPELASNGAHEGTNRYEIGDKDLTSETSTQLDAGLELNSDHFSFTASAFYNNFSNFIFYRRLESMAGSDSIIVDGGNELQAFKFDQRKASLSGAEFTLDIHPHPLDWLHIENNFSFVSGKLKEVIEGTDDLPNVPAARLISEIRGNFFKDHKGINNLFIKTEFDNTFSKNHVFTAFNTETKSAGYFLLNAGIGADVSNAQKRKLFSFFFNANNLTDVAYQNHLSRLRYSAENLATGRIGVFNMGRNYSVKVNIPITMLDKNK
jgi:iron complex outermembrane receptor protein